MSTQAGTFEEEKLLRRDSPDVPHHLGQDKASLIQLDHDLFLHPPWELPVGRDPLIVQPCDQDWRRVQAYADVGAGPVKYGYAVDDEIPRFAERLWRCRILS